MDYSFEPKARFKEMKYFRYSLRTEELFEESIFCRNKEGFLQFLNDMNNGNIYSKFFSQMDREMHRQARDIVLRRNMDIKLDDELELE